MGLRRRLRFFAHPFQQFPAYRNRDQDEERKDFFQVMQGLPLWIFWIGGTAQLIAHLGVSLDVLQVVVIHEAHFARTQ